MTAASEASAAVSAFVAAARQAQERPDGDALTDQELAEAITAAIRLYAARLEFAKRYPAPLTQEATATDVIVAVTEMIRFADLNVFDINMWLNRPRPEDQ